MQFYSRFVKVRRDCAEVTSASRSFHAIVEKRMTYNKIEHQAAKQPRIIVSSR